MLICVFVGAAIFLAYFALISASDLLGLGQPDQQIEVTLTEEQASSLSKTAQVLKDKGVISGKLVFELYGKLKDKEGSFLAKTFVLNNKWGYDQIMGPSGIRQCRVGHCQRHLPRGYDPTTDR